MAPLDTDHAAQALRDEYRAAVADYRRLKNDATAAESDRRAAAFGVALAVGKLTANELDELLQELHMASPAVLARLAHG